MTDFINLDYESRSEIDLKVSGLDLYSAHHSTEIMLAAWSINDGPEQLWDFNDQARPPAELIDALTDPHVEKWAFNAQFERIMTLRRWGIETPYESWRCTMVLAYMMGFVDDLAQVGRSMGIPDDKLKIADGKRLIQLFCKPQRTTKNQRHRWRDALTDPDDWERFRQYNIGDVRAERAIKARLLRPDKYPIPALEWAHYATDQRINDRGVAISRRFANQAIAMAEQRKPQIIKQMARATGLANPGSPAQLLPWLKDRGYPFDDLRADTVKKVIREASDTGITDEAVDVLKMRQNSSKSSIAKYNTMLKAMGGDDRFRFSLQFHGAQRTGRWAGRRLQTQNLPRTPKAYEDLINLAQANKMILRGDLEGLDLLNGEPMDSLVGCIRSAFVPGPGKKFVVCDLSSIESVVIGWLTNCAWFLNTLHAGRDLYRAFAAEWLHIHYDETKPHRGKAKPATLGAGYRLGGGELLPDGKKTGLWAYGENMGVFMSKDEAHSSVAAFRGLCPEIVQTWYALEKAVMKCLSTKATQEVHWELDDGRAFTLPLTIEYRKPFLAIKLPSGRRLYYYDPKIVSREMEGRDGKYTKRQISYMGKPQNKKGWERLYTHGGKLIENCFTSDTVVVTSNGNKPLCEVTVDDKLWDGQTWVGHGGIINQGEREVGEWLGVEVTPNHKILGYCGWKPVAEMDSDTTESALRLARDSERSPCFGLSQEKAGAHACVATAVSMSRCSLTKCTKGVPHGAENAPSQTEARKNLPKGQSETSACGTCGRIDGVGSCLDAGIQNAKPTKTTAGAASMSVSSGQTTETASSNTSKTLCQTGKIPDSTSIESTTTSDMSQGTCGSSRGRLTHATDGQTPALSTADESMSRPSSTRDLSKECQEAHSTGISGMEKTQNRSWRYTGQKTVYDIVNAGPRHRFAIMTNEGMVIVHNCVQAIARDILAIGMRRVEKHGHDPKHTAWPVETVMHIHDELVNETDIEADDDVVLGFVMKCMTSPISWAPGLPLGAAGFVGDFYRKD